MIQATEAIRREIVVPVSSKEAFRVFTARMTDWWPSDHHIGSAPIEEIVIEPHEGGRWYTRHEDGTESSTGQVLAWEPPERLIITWQIGADWRYHVDLVTTVELAPACASSIATSSASVPTPRACGRCSRAPAPGTRRWPPMPARSEAVPRPEGVHEGGPLLRVRR
jgi:hypothetical protein